MKTATSFIVNRFSEIFTVAHVLTHFCSAVQNNEFLFYNKRVENIHTHLRTQT